VGFLKGAQDIENPVGLLSFSLVYLKEMSIHKIEPGFLSFVTLRVTGTNLVTLDPEQTLLEDDNAVYQLMVDEFQEITNGYQGWSRSQDSYFTGIHRIKFALRCFRVVRKRLPHPSPVQYKLVFILFTSSRPRVPVYSPRILHAFSAKENDSS
jgi:hypothetical protein